MTFQPSPVLPLNLQSIPTLTIAGASSLPTYATSPAQYIPVVMVAPELSTSPPQSAPQLLICPTAQSPASSVNIQPAPTTEKDTDMSIQASILDVCERQIDALTRAEGLRDVIDQVKSGRVQAIRDKYGPQKGRTSNPMWGKIKGAVTRRERLYEVLFRDEFGEDESRFFTFFTRERKSAQQEDSLQAFRPVVQAIPHMQADIKAEKTKPCYFDSSGYFSDVIWQDVWEGQNNMEIWRAIGKENYSSRKGDKKAF